jgi:hypothetical protein
MSTVKCEGFNEYLEFDNACLNLGISVITEKKDGGIFAVTYIGGGENDKDN